MTTDVSHRDGTRDLVAIALTCCAPIALAAITASMLSIPWPQYDPRLTGSVSLEHVGSSRDIGSFRLRNQSDHTIYFRGWDGTEPDTASAPEATSEDCQSSKGAGFASPWILDPPEDHFVVVHPGAQRLIDVDTRLAHEYPGGQCKLVLTLTDGTDIESNTWTEPTK